MSARILVTGGSGFVGRHALAPLLAAGAAVHATGRRDPAAASVRFHAVDLLDADAMRAVAAAVRPTHVLHCAWVVEHGAFWTSPLNLDWTAATLHLARACAEAGAKRFVGVGTCVEYDWSDGGAVDRTETDPLRPATLYGTAKAATAAVLQDFGRQAGLSVAWGRLFHLYGPGEDERRLVGSLLKAMRTGEPAALGSGWPVRDFLSSMDAGAALAALVMADSVEGPVNVASGEGIAIADLARELADLVSKPNLLRLGARPDPSGEVPRMVAAVARLQDEVGFRPARSRHERLKELVAKAG